MILKKWLVKSERIKSKSTIPAVDVRPKNTSQELLESEIRRHNSSIRPGIVNDLSLLNKGEKENDEGKQLEIESSSPSIDDLALHDYNETTLQYPLELNPLLKQNIYPREGSGASGMLVYGNGLAKVFGLENFGNTCYCNSILQCLFNLEEFRVNVLQYPQRGEPSVRRRKLDTVSTKSRKFGNANASFSYVPGNAAKTYQSNGSCFCNNVSEESRPNNSSPSPTSKSFSRRSWNNMLKTGEARQEPDKIENENENMSADSSKYGVNSTAGGNEFAKGGVLPSGDQINGCTKQNDTSDDQLKYSGTSNDEESSIDVKSHQESKIIVGRTVCNIGHCQRSDTAANSVQLQTRVINTSSSSSSSSSGMMAGLGLQPQSQPCNSTLPFGVPSIEQRKKAALTTGPVLTIDHSFHHEYFPKDEPPDLYSALKDIFECIVESRSMVGVASPIFFVDVLRKENILFDKLMHQDAHEFLNFLMNSLSESLQQQLDKMPDMVPENFIKSLFQGTMTNSVTCLTCDSVTSSDEPFLDFAIPVTEDEEVNIQDMLEDFHQREMLNGANKFYCDSCNSLQEAERTVGLKQLPKFLLLHLKRFKYNEQCQSNIKLFNTVHYPLTLKVCSTFDSSVCKNYELRSVVIHMGGGPQHGHYVTICKHDLYGWLLFDDETVESVSEDSVLKYTGDPKDTTAAYVLFYKEITTPGKGTKVDYADNIEQMVKFDDWIKQQGVPSVSNQAVLSEDVAEKKDSNIWSPLKKRTKLFSFKRTKD
ncbi:HHL136Cp [Eremothecium sinecaudum]|uniref:Ubiquitin carboxyl-terminal hydrolase n=1 Tax=Eremothecium sinecaudum TaxID=45286 RepID=A0A0X8HW54_9SACH|nr:HHL136Cp [Eremothecium sinecaudum]AMD22634.1 HHL136Cp [Eremothecium sinecaudum]